MSNSRRTRSEQQLSPDIIGSAPLEPDAISADQGDLERLSEEYYLVLNKLEEAEAENKRLKERMTVEEAKAAMMKPYADAVFWFVVWYCLIVASIVIACGVQQSVFKLSDTILGIIAGSTAVSVIGLIGIVAGGLFGSGRGKAAKKKRG